MQWCQHSGRTLSLNAIVWWRPSLIPPTALEPAQSPFLIPFPPFLPLISPHPTQPAPKSAPEPGPGPSLPVLQRPRAVLSRNGSPAISFLWSLSLNEVSSPWLAYSSAWLFTSPIRFISFLTFLYSFPLCPRMDHWKSRELFDITLSNRLRML